MVGAKIEMGGVSIGLPQDEWAHPDALHEWWYVNSHLTDSDGRQFGLVIAFFPDYMLFGLADKLERRMISARVTRGLRLGSSATGIRLGNSYLVRRERVGSYSLKCASDNLSLDLSLETRKGPLLVNRVGRIREGLLGKSWYYALTNIDAEGSISLERDERRVTGSAWIDRQWGRWEDMGIGGWDWFSMQLSNGSEVLATQIYAPVSRRTCSRVVSVKRGDSSEYHSTNLQIRRVDSFVSKSSGSNYGRKWLIESPGVVRLDVEADFEEQEIHRGLWEGCCSAHGTMENERVTGVGYAEQVDRSMGPLSELLSFATAPGHFLLQSVLGRANLGVWDLSEKLGMWRILSVR